ncbi:MAG: Asp23/Gls24 family envelope stress response protein [Ruminococcaceae bacterium]|nr:Asp23/Gls24 family envelope stress response protein [Oscillospiraceae bacterium]
MSDNKDYMIHHEDMGTIQISEDVVATIATTTTLEVDGVGGLMNANMADYLGGKKLSAKGVRVELVDGAILVHLFIMIRYGSSVAEVAGKVQSGVYAALKDMTGFEVKAVNVHVGGICFE